MAATPAADAATFTVTSLTKMIAGVNTAVVWIEDISDGVVVEKEIAFYAQDDDGTVWYLGEPIKWNHLAGFALIVGASFLNRSRGLLVTGSRLLRTLDGGRSWRGLPGHGGARCLDARRDRAPGLIGKLCVPVDQGSLRMGL